MNSLLVKVGDQPMISPHRLAPLYNSSPENQQILLRHAIEIMTGRGLDSTNLEDVTIVRETGFVNMWFFLRFIASHNGPYDLLNEDLHVDMCNFYQLCAFPGMKGAGFLFRGGYKSSVWTHGGNSWDMLRDPNVEIILASNIFKRSLEFLEYSKITYQQNEVVKICYPEYVPDWGARHAHWNQEEMILPNKTKHKTRPNIQVISVGGSAQGAHCDILKIDDLIGEHQLDANMMGGVEFEKAANWARAAVRNIPKKNRESRIFCCGTRYGPNDAYTWIWNDLGSFYGCTTEEPYELKSNGEWTGYYRAAREDLGEERKTISMPEKWTHAELDKIEKEDPWTYFTQIQNRSTFSGLSELAEYTIKEVDLLWEEGTPRIEKTVSGGQLETRYLSDMDIVVAVDPAGMAKKETARTSKYAVGAYARDCNNNRYVLDVKTDYGPPSKWIPIMFDMFNRYRRVGCRGTFVEMIGPFSILLDRVQEEQRARQQSILLRPVRSQQGEKRARIRIGLQPLIDVGQLYATKGCARVVQDGLMSYPSGTMDVLDMIATAEEKSIQPTDPEQYEDEEAINEERRQAGNRWTGY